MADYFVATTGSDITGDGSEGNPWASPGYAAGQISAGDSVGIQPGTYTVSVNTGNVTNGFVNLSGTAFNSYWYGVSTPPVINQSITNPSLGLFRVGNVSFMSLRNVIFNGTAGGASQVGVTASTNNNVDIRNCGFIGCGSHGLTGGTNNGLRATNCWAEACGDGFNGVNYLTGCIATNCTVGFQSSTAQNPKFRNFCIAYQCGTGFRQTDNSSIEGIGNIACDCTGHGFTFDGTLAISRMHLVGCMAINNGGYGYHINPSDAGIVRHALTDCADFGNTSGRKLGGFLDDVRPLTLTDNPFVDPDNGDFNLNSLPGGGNLLRAAQIEIGYTTMFPFRSWLEDIGGGGSPSRIRQGNLLGRSF